MSEPHVVILGGGPAGVGAAYKLRKLGRGRATLIEAKPELGGNAGSFEHEGFHLDYGSHRLHHATEPEILADIRSMLGDDLKDRPRNGRIRLRGKWVKFPLRGSDLLLRLDKAFAFGAARDMALRSLPLGKDEGDTFASVLRAKLGPTICDHFYYPYARKLWGYEPSELSGIQAQRRVSANSFAKLLKKVVKPTGGGKFFYPKQGFGQISEAYGKAAQDLGAELLREHKVERLLRPAQPGGRFVVEVSCGSERRQIEADHVLSTLPVPLLARIMEPGAPAHVLEAAKHIDYRAMILVYLELDVDQFTTTDAHYFPEENVRMTRLSEPKNYFGHSEPKGRTVLCAEVPCSADEALWSMDDAALGQMVVDDIRRVELPLGRPPVRVFARRLRQAYPIYLNGYEKPLAVLDEWASSIPGFTSYGRQGLFAHDNTHHALFMAYCAVDCLQDGRFDEAKWRGYREVFKTHVVED
ncbi:MAG TPA: FAD-dependent oxidoreductase [Polyangiales bacterium]